MNSPIKKKPKLAPPKAIRLPSRKKHFKFSIDGNIAAGKSTLIDSLNKARPEWNVFQEPVAKWTNVASSEYLTTSQQNGGNLLKMFYDDKNRWSYTFQTYALFSKLRLHSKPIASSLSTSGTISFYERSYYSDRYIFAENCFEQGFMVETEWNIYKEWCNYLVKSLGGDDLDGLVYLRASPKVCVSRRMKRGRPEEKGIPMEYIQSLHNKHESLFYDRCIKVNESFSKLPILVIDCDEEVMSTRMMERNIATIEKFVSKIAFTEEEDLLNDSNTSKGPLDSTGNSEESGSGSDLEL